VQLKYRVGTDTGALTKLHFAYTGSAPTTADATSIANGIASAWNTNLATLMANGLPLEDVTVTDLASSTGVEVTVSTSYVGSRSGSVNANSVAVLTNASVARRYRGGKPRSYMPGGVANDLSAGQWTSSFQTAWNTGYRAFIAAVEALSAGGTSLSNSVSVSYYSGFTSVTNPITGRTKDVAKLRTGGPVVDTITAWSINPSTGNQRRRAGA
jgi:hypothetical protein